MRIVCVGGGPAGLYFAILSKLREPDARVGVYERNPSGITFGWGVTFSDDVLDSLYAADPVSAKQIQRNPASWHNQIARVAGRPTGHMGGYGFAIGREAAGPQPQPDPGTDRSTGRPWHPTAVAELRRVTRYGWGRWARGQVSSPKKRQKARDSAAPGVAAAQLVTLQASGQG